MAICVQIFRGQGVFIEGRGYGTVHRFESPTEVLIKFREGFETIPLNQLLPVSNLPNLVTVAHRYHENDLELSPRDRDDQYEPEVSDEEPQEQREEFAEEMDD